MMTIKSLLEYYGGETSIFIEVYNDYIVPGGIVYKGSLSEMPYKFLDKEIEWWAIIEEGLEIVIK